MTFKKILIYGEGPTDVGVVNVYGEWEKGCIVTLIQRINPTINIDFIPPPRKEVISATRVVPMKGKTKIEGHGIIIQKLIIYARKKNLDYDLIVYYGDTDKQSASKNTIHEAKKTSEAAYHQAFKAFDIFHVDGIPIIPLRMLESWLLADSTVYRKMFNAGSVPLPAQPELIWGEKSNRLNIT